MALVSTKGTYGLMALYELSQNGTTHPMRINEISQNANVPKNYLEQLLPRLKKIGVVKSIRGAQGGYLLAKNPKDIKIIDILEALEDGLNISDDKSTNAMLKIYFAEVKKRLDEVFGISLDELSKYEDRLKEYLHYSI